MADVPPQALACADQDRAFADARVGIMLTNLRTILATGDDPTTVWYRAGVEAWGVPREYLCAYLASSLLQLAGVEPKLVEQPAEKPVSRPNRLLVAVCAFLHALTRD